MRNRDSVRERPILFSGPMVRAILAGTKTQTRRLVKPQPEPNSIGGFRWLKGCFGWSGPKVPQDLFAEHCPYGMHGDRLWVRETWGLHAYCDLTDWHRGSIRGAKACPEWELDYRADWQQDLEPNFWRPSIHMPRWASRITLEVTEVRVERLTDIGTSDAVAEGTPCWVCGRHVDGLSENDCACFHTTANAVESFQVLWDSINGKSAPWSSNPWVWATSFRRVE